MNFVNIIVIKEALTVRSGVLLEKILVTLPVGQEILHLVVYNPNFHNGVHNRHPTFRLIVFVSCFFMSALCHLCH